MEVDYRGWIELAIAVSAAAAGAFAFMRRRVVRDHKLDMIVQHFAEPDEDHPDRRPIHHVLADMEILAAAARDEANRASEQATQARSEVKDYAEADESNHQEFRADLLEVKTQQGEFAEFIATAATRQSDLVAMVTEMHGSLTNRLERNEADIVELKDGQSTLRDDVERVEGKVDATAKEVRLIKRLTTALAIHQRRSRRRSTDDEHAEWTDDSILDQALLLDENDNPIEDRGELDP